MSTTTEPEGRGSGEKDWKEIAAVYEKSYDEVLSALKHQDDKLNRTLTAIAFLTAAGIALFANVALKISPPVRFDESPRTVTSFFFLVFLGAVAFGLMFALSAIGPSRGLPGLGKRQEPAIKEWPSLLFYLQIIKDPGWANRITEKEVPWLQQCLARNFLTEAQTLGCRVDYKVAGSRQSAACVHIALLALALLGIFSTEQYALANRWWLAAVLLAVVLALPLLDWVSMRAFGFETTTSVSGQGLSYICALIAAGTGSALLFGAPSWDAHWWAIFYSLAAITSIRLSYVHERVARIALPATAVGGVVCVLLAWLA
jgi:hypothetical protein